MKFAQVSIFSTLNQLIDLGLNKAYERLCGMTATEIQDTFGPELDKMAEENSMSPETVMDRMRAMYDGYHFSRVMCEGMISSF